MEFKEVINKALEIRKAYNKLEVKKGGKAWNKENIALGFAGDVGQLMKLVQACNGVREIPDAKKKLEHELADCLWSVIVLADEYDVNLESSFQNLMNELKAKIQKET